MWGIDAVVESGAVWVLNSMKAMGAGRLGWEAKRVQALATELVEGLSGLGRPAEAATVAATHLNDIETAVHLFSQAHEWRQVCVLG